MIALVVDSVLQKLCTAAIATDKIPMDDFMEAYSSIYHACRRKKTVASDLSRQKTYLLTRFLHSTPVTTAAVMATSWETFKRIRSGIHVLFYFVHRITKTSTRDDTILFYNLCVKPNLSLVCDDMIHGRRARHDRDVFCAILHMFYMLEEEHGFVLYPSFEKRFLTSLLQEYQVHTDADPDTVIAMYHREESFSREFHMDRSWDKMREVFARILIAPRCDFWIHVFMERLARHDLSALPIVSLLPGVSVAALYKDHLRAVLASTDGSIDSILSIHAGEERIQKALGIEKERVLQTAWRDYMDEKKIRAYVRYLDKKIRRGEGCGEEVWIFEALADKDLFMDHYREAMKARLLENYDVPLSIEKAWIDTWRGRMGVAYVLHLGNMVYDIHHARERNGAGARTTVSVLSAVSWRLSKEPSSIVYRVPALIRSDLDAFLASYSRDKRLDVIHALGTVVLRGFYDSGVYNLTMSPPQAMYLLDEAREDDGGGGYDEALRASCIEVLDRSFVSARRNIRLPKVVRASTFTTATTTAYDRNHGIDAALVRIMKARRVVAHADLVALLDANVRQIKQRIEDLIAREYISRDEADPKIYHYVP
jgi:hypothetical protein